MMNNYTNESILVKQLMSQDANAFKILYNNYSAALFGVIVRYHPDKEIAEEIFARPVR